MDRYIRFLIIHFCCVMFMVYVEFFGPHDHALVLFAIPLLILAYEAYRRPSATLLFASVLLAGSGFALIAAVYLGDSLVQVIGLRHFFHTEHYLRIALAVVAVQLAALMSFFLLQGNRGLHIGSSMLSITWANSYVGPIKFRLIVAFGLVLLSFLSNPSRTILTETYGTEEFLGETFLIGGWSLLFILLYSYYAVVTRCEKTFDFLLSLALLGFWLLHGNRSEVLGIVIILGIAALARSRASSVHKSVASNQQRSVRQALFAALVVMSGIVLFQAVGAFRAEINEARRAGSYGQVLESIEGQSVLVVSTVGPSVYALTASIGLIEEGAVKLQYGRTYMEYLARTLPANWNVGSAKKEDISLTLIEEAQALGGAHFGGEPYINLKILGAYLYALMFGALVWFITRKANSSVLFATFNLALLMLAPRVIWYGHIYLYKALLVMLSLWLVARYIAHVRTIGRQQPA